LPPLLTKERVGVRFYKEILAPSPYQGEGWGEVLQGDSCPLSLPRRGLG